MALPMAGIAEMMFVRMVCVGREGAHASRPTRVDMHICND